ncbi:MAG: bifunctional folylpolyglutamate synthase/dihydrofolate synthase, partial [Burkholderiaceae bacterium]|nr:bifunctional folylpolyglutamate synthase/dihydrofolate synthase [Burkholderiaceae bacterium]
MSDSLSLSQWLVHLESMHPVAIDMGLDRVAAVGERLKLHFDCPVITVGGTNGKGSTCAMLESMLMQGSYRVGLYTSPHILDFNERARIDGHSASDTVLCDAFAAVEAVRGDISLTYFEFTTLAILKLFADTKLDVVILEVGLGGRLDAVNI